MVKKKLLILIVLVTSFGLILHNLYFYPITAGYDAWLHINYAKIISFNWRFPTLVETREAYNPPLFYLLSGLITRIVSYFTHLDFVNSLKIWQYLHLVITFGFLYFWWDIIKLLEPKSKLFRFIVLALIFSLPVFHKTIVMYNLELFSAFMISLVVWFFVTHVQKKCSYKNILNLAFLTSLALLTRLSAAVLLPVILLGFIGLYLIHKINLQKLIKFSGLFLAIIILLNGWFYLGRANRDIYQVGEGGEPDKPLFQRQPLSFYTEIPFRLMMSYPIRFAPQTPLNRLIPIYYSEVWGDWWNYYSQRRFGLSVEAVRADRYLTSDQRVVSLAIQNQVNLLPTILMIIGFIYLFYQSFKSFIKKPDQKQLTHLILIFLTLFIYAGWLLMITKYPSWKGDSIKASYMLATFPVIIYSLTLFLFEKIKPIKMIFMPISVCLIIASLINLYWSWY